MCDSLQLSCLDFPLEEPSMDQCQSRGKVLTNFQRHWSIRISLKTRQKGHRSLQISPEIRMDQWLPNLSEVLVYTGIGPQSALLCCDSGNRAVCDSRLKISSSWSITCLIVTQQFGCVQLAGYFGTELLRFPRLDAQICDMSSCMIRLIPSIPVNAR